MQPPSAFTGNSSFGVEALSHRPGCHLSTSHWQKGPASFLKVTGISAVSE